MPYFRRYVIAKSNFRENVVYNYYIYVSLPYFICISLHAFKTWVIIKGSQSIFYLLSFSNSSDFGTNNPCLNFVDETGAETSSVLEICENVSSYGYHNLGPHQGTITIFTQWSIGRYQIQTLFNLKSKWLDQFETFLVMIFHMDLKTKFEKLDWAPLSIIVCTN